jgi:hypothetical protein
MKIRDPLEKSAGAKARNQSNRYRRTKVRRSHKTKIAAAKYFFRKRLKLGKNLCRKMSGLKPGPISEPKACSS